MFFEKISNLTFSSFQVKEQKRRKSNLFSIFPTKRGFVWNLRTITLLLKSAVLAFYFGFSRYLFTDCINVTKK